MKIWSYIKKLFHPTEKNKYDNQKPKKRNLFPEKEQPLK